MSGTVEHMSLREARRDANSEQSRLQSFAGSGDTTYVGVFRRGEGDDVVDERVEALAPPEELFYQWLSLRDQYRDDRALTTVQAHEKALRDVSYRPRYQDHLKTDTDAQRALDRLTERVRDGENIILVCYCTEDRWCHREPVTERIQSRLEELRTHGST